MKKKMFLGIILGITAFALPGLLLTKLVVEPRIGKKIEASLNERSGD